MNKNLLNLKRITTTLVLLAAVSLVQAADRYAVATGNWNATTTWATTAGGAPGATVPVAGDNVFIVGGFNVTIPNAVTSACTNLNITVTGVAGTGTLTFGGSTATLNASGNVVVGTAGSGSREGVITMTSGGILNIGGNLTIGNDGATGTIASEINQGANSTITVAGNVSIVTPGNNYANQWAVNNGVAAVTGTLTLANTGGNTQDCNVIVTTGTLSVDGTITMSGSAGENSISITGAGTFNIGGTFTTSGGTFSPGATSTVNYDGATQSLRAATYQNLTFSGSAAKTIPTSTTVNGKLSVQGTATVSGNAPTYGTNAVLEYKGSAAQTTGSVEFPGTVNVDLVIDNAAGVSLNGTKNLSGSLTLTNGVLTTTSSNLLNFADGFATVAGGSVSSYINGPVRKTGNDAFTFPVGKSGVYAPVTITAPDANTDAFTVEYVRGAGSLGAIDASIAANVFRASSCEYWNIVETTDAGSANSISVTVTWSAGSGCGTSPYITDVTKLTLLHFNTTTNKWDSYGGTASGTANNGTILRTGVSTFSPFTLGSLSVSANPLPVSFVNEKAFEKGSGVQIEWTNATESDMSAYVIERSADGISFTTIGQTTPRSNQFDKVSYTFVDAAPLAGTNFYRVKAVELTGKHVYSKALRVDIGRSPKGISLYPNPVRGSVINIGFSALKGQYSLNVLNTAGQVVYRQSINHAGGNMSQSVSLPASLKAGVYNVLISGDNYKETKMFVIQ